ncbi:MAG: FadR/GntR family transcriptional regulator [Thermomicrobiales bacterium]
MDPKLFPSLNDGSVTERAVQLLSDLITSGKLAAGEFLPSEPTLSKQLGISRGTIRMALKTLEMRGLVIPRRGIGVEVANRTRQVAIDSLELMLQHGDGDITDAFEVRSMLEGQSARLAAERATDGDFVEIAAAMERIEVPGLSIDEQIDADLDFHLRLCEASKNPILVALAMVLRGLLRDAIASTLVFEAPDSPREHEHRLILETLRARDPERAQHAMNEHMRKSIRRATTAAKLESLGH